MLGAMSGSLIDSLAAMTYCPFQIETGPVFEIEGSKKIVRRSSQRRPIRSGSRFLMTRF